MKVVENPTAALVLIGNELLSGRTPDANLSYISRRLEELGIRLMECRVVRDEKPKIMRAVNALRSQFTYVFTTGGIGSTHDDITVECIAEAFGAEMERNNEVVERFDKKKIEENWPITENTYRMADYPVGARLIENGATVAPGFQLGNVFALAGIPKYAQSMFEAVVPFLQTGQPMHSLSIDVLAPESVIGEAFSEIQDRYAALELGSYPFRHEGRPGTSLVIKGVDRDLVDSAYRAVEMMLDEVGAPKR